ncbi:MAG: DsrE family protein [Candidatus Omnitrophota bacterium]
MNKKQLFYLSGTILAMFYIVSSFAQVKESSSKPNPNDSRLAVVWTSGDPDVAHRVCLMYSHAALQNKWFDEVRLIVWGPSARLLAGDKDLQAKIKKMMEDGVIVQACIVCADSYGVTETLRGLGIEVKAMGQPLTSFLKENYKILTF